MIRRIQLGRWLSTHIWLFLWLLGITQVSHAQVYYILSDAGTSTADQLRSSPLTGSSETTVVPSNTTNFPSNPGAVVYDAANNRLLVLNTVSNSPRIAAVDLSTDAVSTFLTPAATAGASITTFTNTGLAIANGNVYYMLSDASTTTNDQLRSYPLAGGSETIVVPSNTTNFPSNPGAMAYDAANNRLLILNNLSSNPYIAAVSLSTGAVSTFLTPAPISGTTTTFTGTGLAIANGNVYYMLSDVGGTADQLRSYPLAGGSETIVVPSNTTNFPSNPGAMAYDAANNRLLVLNNLNNSSYIAAVSLSTGAVSTFLTPAPISGSNSTFSGTGIAVAGIVSPSVTTASATGITTTSAMLGGNVTADGGSAVTGRGVVYSSTNSNPEIGGSGVTPAANGSGTGTFSATISNLNPGTRYYVAAYATNSVGTSYGSVQTFVTLPPTITVAPATLPNGTVGVGYSQAITASGGTSPYSYAVTAGMLPSGLTLSSAGVLSGTPVGGGSYTFTLTATDGATSHGPYSGSRSYTVVIAPPTITVGPATLPNGMVGVGYSEAITASGGTSPYVYAVTAGALPSGLTLSGTGQLSGTPTGGGTYTFTISATDVSTGSGPYSSSRSYSVTIAAPTITVAPATLPNGTVGVVYSQAITASGGTNPYSYALTAGALPSGLTLSGTGQLSGTPTGGGTYTFTISATDASTGSGPYSGSRSYSLTIAAPTITVSPATLPNGTVGAAYSQAITASGGTSPYAYALTAGALPSGLTLSSAGVLSGTPTGGGSYNFTLTATDASTGSGPYSGSRSYSLTIAAPTIMVAPATLPNGTVGVVYSQAITASGGTSPYSYALTAGALPSGLTLSGTGQLSGTPTGGGTYTFTLTATDASTGSGPYTGSRGYSLIIVAPTIMVAPATLPNGTLGMAYSQTITASGGTSPYSYALTAGTLPSGLTLSSAGVLSGTPVGGGSYTFTLTATDASTGSGPYSGSRSYTVVIAPPTINGLVVTPASVCVGNRVTVTATIGQSAGTYSYTLIYGSQIIVGSTTSTVSQTLTASGSGQQSIVLRAGNETSYSQETTALTVNALPVVSITGLANDYCQDAPAVTLMGTPAGAGGSFTIDGTSASMLTPMSLSVGQHTVAFRYTDGNGCSNSTSQPVTIKATPPVPSLLTQTGQSYPGSQSAVTVDLNTGTVNLVASGCAGQINWTGPNNTAGTSTTIPVSTTQSGTFTYRASCTVNGCTSPLATAIVTVGGRLTVLHRDVDNYADNNAIQPLLQIQNQGAGALPLSKLTLRYYVTVEGAATLGNLSLSYAQVGNQNVRLRYVALNPAQTGAGGYVEYSFTEGAGSLAAGANSGPIQAYFTKSDYGPLNELNDYSYNPVRNQLTGNLRITAYYDGALIAGVEPGSATQIRAVRALTESKNGASATQINTYLEVRNEGNVALNYSDLKVRYYFTSDGNERLLVEVDEGNVRTQLVKLAQPVAGADTYLELSFNQSGQLAPGTSTGTIRYRISKPDGGRFNQANDWSYQEQPQDRSQNSRVVVYAGADRLWGQEPGGSARVAFVEAGTTLSVKVLGNPIQNDQVSFEVSGTDGQALEMQLLTPQGRVISQRQVPSAEATQPQQLSLAGQTGGVFLLQVSTPSQSQTVKVLKAN